MTVPRRALGAAAALVACAAARAVAQEPTPSPARDTARVLAPITVAAARPRPPAPPVAVIEAPPEALQRTLAANGWDFVRRTTGIEVHDQGQGPGYAPNAVVRGFTSDHSSEVLLELDGVPVNLPVHGHMEGYADWSLLPELAVISLRVIPGPASPLHGDFALGGVVEARTAADADGAGLRIGGASPGDATVAALLGAHRDNRGGLLLASGSRDAGWRHHAGGATAGALLRGWRRAGALHLEGGVLARAAGWDAPGFVSVARYNAGDLRTPADTTDGGWARRVIAHAHGHGSAGVWQLDGLAWAHTAGSAMYLNIPDEDTVAQSEERDRRVGAGASLTATRSLGRGVFTAGFSTRYESASYERWTTDRRLRDSLLQSLDGRHLELGVVARWQAPLAASLIADAAARLDLLRYATAAPARPDSAATHLVASPKLGLRWLAGSGWTATAALTRGFRGAPGALAEPGRVPVTAWSAEASLQHAGRAWNGQLALFRTRVTHERILNPVTLALSDAGSSVRQGVWTALSWRPSARWQLDADLTVNDARIRGVGAGGAFLRMSGAPGRILPQFDIKHEAPLRPGDLVPAVARYHGRAGIDADVRGVSVRAETRFTGPFAPIGEPDVRTAAWAVLDLSCEIPLGDRAALDVALTNVADARYPEMRASGYLNPGAPRMLRAAMRLGGQPSAALHH